MPEFKSFDGTRLTYFEWPGRDDQPPVILLHGFIAHSLLNWEGPGIVDAMTGLGRRVIALDARGHGQSEKPHDSSRYGEDAMAKDVSTLIDLLEVPIVDLIGYSMGAVVALLTSVLEWRIRRLVVGGVGAGVVEVGGLDSRVIPPEEVSAALLSEVPPDPSTPAGGFRAFAEMVGGDRRALAAVVSAAHATSIPLGAVTVPTLVIAGEEDELAVRPKVLADAIANATLVTLPGDHLTVLRDPGFIPALIHFIDAP